MPHVAQPLALNPESGGTNCSRQLESKIWLCIYRRTTSITVTIWQLFPNHPPDALACSSDRNLSS
jgi:hypothetical protein